MLADPEPGGTEPAGFARTLRKLQRHGRRARRYAGDIRWILRDFLGRIGWQALRIVVSGLLYIGTKFLSVALLYVVVHAMSDGFPPAMAGWPLPEPRSVEFLVMAVGAAFLVLFLSSWLRYDVRSRGITLGRDYEEYCGRRIFTLASRLPDPRTPVANRVIATEPMHLYLGYARHCGMAARQLSQLLPTLVSFVAGCVVMIWLDAATTAGLAVLALIALLAQYPANHKAAQASRDWERSRSDAMRRIVELFGGLRKAPTPIEMDGPVLNRLYTDDSMLDYVDGFSDRSHAAEQASLVSRIGSALVLCGAMLLLGMDIVDGQRSWAAVAAFVAAVRFTLTDFVQVSTLANGFTRFHAQLTLYRRFVDDAVRATVPLPVKPAERPPVLRVPDLVAGTADWSPAPGSLAALLMPPVPAGSLPMMLVDAAEPGGEPALLARIDRVLLDDFAPLRSLLGLDEAVAEADIAAALAAFDAQANTLFETPGWLDHPATRGWRQELSPAQLAGLQAVAAGRRGATVVTTDLALVHDLGPQWRDAAMGELAAAVVLLVYQPTDVTGNLDLHLARLGRLGETAAVVADGQRLVGWVALDGPGKPPPELGRCYREVLRRVGPRGASAATEDEEEVAAVE